jgi:26S proteasome regulatory subunit N9
MRVHLCPCLWQVLDSSPYKWLHELLECFNHGDLHQYDALCAKHAAVLNAQPALVENERRLREKVRAWMARHVVIVAA